MTTELDDSTTQSLKVLGEVDQPLLRAVGPALMVRQSGTCILCHTIDYAVSEATLESGGGWKCARCGQRWDAGRLAAAEFSRECDQRIK